MRVATKTLIFIAMLSTAFILAGIYLYGMDKAFNIPFGHSIFTPYHTDEGTTLGAFGILGFTFSVLGFLILLMIATVRRLLHRA